MFGGRRLGLTDIWGAKLPTREFETAGVDIEWPQTMDGTGMFQEHPHLVNEFVGNPPLWPTNDRLRDIREVLNARLGYKQLVQSFVHPLALATPTDAEVGLIRWHPAGSDGH